MRCVVGACGVWKQENCPCRLVGWRFMGRENVLIAAIIGVVGSYIRFFFLLAAALCAPQACNTMLCMMLAKVSVV